MKFTFLLLLLSQVQNITSSSQEVKVEVAPYEPVVITFQTTPKENWEATDKVQAISSSWKSNLKYIQTSTDNSTTFYCWAPPGNYSLSGELFLINWTKQDIDQRQYLASVSIRGETPQPPQSLPFETTGLTILIFKEAQDILPPEQKSIFTSPSVINWALQNCTVIEGRKAFRVWDDDFTEADFANVSPILKSAYFKVKSSPNFTLPWIAISNGTKGVSQPLPISVADTLKLFQTFAP